jgi:hypothetical protein
MISYSDSWSSAVSTESSFEYDISVSFAFKFSLNFDAFGAGFFLNFEIGYGFEFDRTVSQGMETSKARSRSFTLGDVDGYDAFEVEV